jgi:hypothetical protein
MKHSLYITKHLSLSLSYSALSHTWVMASPIFLGFWNNLGFTRETVIPTRSPQQFWRTNGLLHRKPAWHGKPHQLLWYCQYTLVDPWKTQALPPLIKILQPKVGQTKHNLGKIKLKYLYQLYLTVLQLFIHIYIDYCQVHLTWQIFSAEQNLDHNRKDLTSLLRNLYYVQYTDNSPTLLTLIG